MRCIKIFILLFSVYTNMQGFQQYQPFIMATALSCAQSCVIRKAIAQLTTAGSAWYAPIQLQERTPEQTALRQRILAKYQEDEKISAEDIEIQESIRRDLLDEFDAKIAKDNARIAAHQAQKKWLLEKKKCIAMFTHPKKLLCLIALCAMLWYASKQIAPLPTLYQSESWTQTIATTAIPFLASKAATLCVSRHTTEAQKKSRIMTIFTIIFASLVQYYAYVQTSQCFSYIILAPNEHTFNFIGSTLAPNISTSIF
jgi:hypothetical protein